MAASSTSSIRIEAAPSAVAAVITDFTRYPQWVDAISAVSVIESEAQGLDAGLARVVQFHLDAGIVSDVYVLRYTYQRAAEGWLCCIEWELVASQTQKSQHGSYRLEPLSAAATQVTYSLSVELKVPLLEAFKRKAERVIMDTALRKLKKQVEANG